MLRTGTFATRTVVPAVAAVKVPRELPVEQACLIGCAVATGVMSVLETAKVWEGARVAVIGCGAVGLSVIQGARIAGASEIRAIDLDERKLEQATRFGATHTEPGPVDFVFDVVGAHAATFEQGLGLIGSRRHGRPDRAFARRGEGGARPAAAVREARARSSSPTAATTCRRRTSRGSRTGRSKASSTSRAWSPARRRSRAGSDASRRCSGGDVIRTVLLP